MNTIDENDKALGKILRYGVQEAPAELELMVMNRLEAVKAPPKRSYMGFVVGWVPLSISLLGLIFGAVTSIVLFFPEFTSILNIFNKIQRLVHNPSVAIIILSVVFVVFIDSLLERRMGRISPS